MTEYNRKQRSISSQMMIKFKSDEINANYKQF